jgi:peptide deformylase
VTQEAGAQCAAIAIRPVREAPDPRWRVNSAPVKTIDDGLRTLIADMFEQMYAAPRFGLAV